jgi:predicted CXXCH cytochrome family protein
LKGSLLDTFLRCHNQEVALPDGRKVANVATLLKENPNHHGPVRQGDCSACHNPHASSHFELLTETYPERFYAAYDPNDYKLCFTCHGSELASSEDGRGGQEERAAGLADFHPPVAYISGAGGRFPVAAQEDSPSLQ